MWPDGVSHPGPLIYESGALPTALRGPAWIAHIHKKQTSTRINREIMDGWMTCDYTSFSTVFQSYPGRRVSS